jgi:2-aminoethylphosphonate transport system substrate-binding protein
MRVLARVLTVAASAALLAGVAACGGTAGGDSAGGASKTVVVYSADGLEDWYKKEFNQFTAQTGINVQVTTAGSGEVLSRVEKEKSNPQADVLVTLPPFIQEAAQKGVLQPYAEQGLDQVPAGLKDGQNRYVAFMNNYLCFIVNPQTNPAPRTWNDLLDPRFKGKIQYSTPGQAGDGTAVLLELQHVFGDQGALDYLNKLQANNVGPSSSTGKLQPKVEKGELQVANGDVQMNLQELDSVPNGFQLLFPADASGNRSTLSIPYYAGLVTGAPHNDSAKKLLDFLLSQQLQQATTDAYGAPTRQDVQATGANGQKITAALRGVQIWQPDWDTVLTNLDTDVAAYNKATGQ